MANYVERLDQLLADLLSDWGVISTLLTLVIVAFAAYPILYPDEPDTHPLLLSRQAQAAPIRNKNESAAYRSPEVLYGNPLRSGLNVKDAGAPRWASGKDGDLRDVWREVQRGGTTGPDGKEIPKGAIMTLYGRDEAVEHDIGDLSKEINVMGKHFKDVGVKNVAIYLPNSVEYLSTVFACAFYGLTPILLPYNQAHAKIYDLLNTTSADTLICAAGNLPLDDLAEQCKHLRLLTWVVEKSSRHMDWNGVPDSAADHLTVSVWHDVVDEHKSTASADLPTNEQGEKPGDVIAVWQSSQPTDAPADIVTFTQGNLVAATAALISALPLRQRFTPADLILPADSFTHTYILCQTLATLFTHASLAINSVALPGVDLALASRSISPTVILASAETMASLHAKASSTPSSALQKLGTYFHSQALAAGRMPKTDSLSFSLLAPSSSAAGNAPGTLRLILTSERLGAGSPALTSNMLSELRMITRARICYALTAARVAGAIAQTMVFDYRVDAGDHRAAHFGLPVSSVEVKLTNEEDELVGGNRPEGEIVVMGPAVCGGEVRLGVKGRFREDGVLEYA